MPKYSSQTNGFVHSAFIHRSLHVNVKEFSNGDKLCEING